MHVSGATEILDNVDELHKGRRWDLSSWISTRLIKPGGKVLVSKVNF